MKLGTRLYTLFFGTFVGSDEAGNRYYERKGGRYKRAQRWVTYRGLAEPSKVPAQWHGWLHHINDRIPSATDSSHAWQKEHVQNLTGTAGAYYPPGHIFSGGKREKATGDYTAWEPK